jgi:excinuclease UvrABC nuclease subunit
MDNASAALDFERARRLFDQLNQLPGGASREAADVADTSRLERQQPQANGIFSPFSDRD